MNVDEHRDLLRQRAIFARMVELASPEDVIGRPGLEQKLASLEEELKRYEGQDPRTISLVLSLNDMPRQAQRRVPAAFAGTAVGLFAAAFAGVGQCYYSRWDVDGSVVQPGDLDLTIDEVLHGAGGFVLERLVERAAYPGILTPFEVVAQHLINVMELSGNGDDGGLADAIRHWSEEAKTQVCDFLARLADHEAICSVKCGNRRFAFEKPEGVRQARQLMGHSLAK